MTTNANMQKSRQQKMDRRLQVCKENQKKRSVKGSESTGCAGIDVEQLYLPWSN